MVCAIKNPAKTLGSHHRPGINSKYVIKEISDNLLLIPGPLCVGFGWHPVVYTVNGPGIGRRAQGGKVLGYLASADPESGRPDPTVGASAQSIC